MNTREPIITKHYYSPCGTLILGSINNKLCLCDWIVESHREKIDRRLKRALMTGYEDGTSDIIESAIRQLDEYFAGKRQKFDMPLLLVGTDFQVKVWRELQNITYGETISYSEMARRLGMPKAVRAVANANGANSISIFIPCHRVIGRDHSLTGYGGGLATKCHLIDLESSHAAFLLLSAKP